MRIIYVNPPPPPSMPRFLGEMAVYILAGYVLALLLVQISAVNFLLRPLYEIIAPLVNLPLRLSGVLRVSQPAYNGILVVFLFLLVRALMSLIAMTRWASYAISEQDHAVGYIAVPVHRRWFWRSAFLLVVATIGNFLPPLIAPDVMTQMLIDCTRILAVVGGLSGAVAAAMIGNDLRQSWIRGGCQGQASVVSKTRTKPDLKVVATNAPPAKPPVPPLYVALAAELVQRCGMTGAIPSVDLMVSGLSALQHAARLTGTQSVTDAELKGLCERVLALFTAGQIEAMPTLEAAKKLYARKGPGVLTPLAEELARKLTLN